MIDTHCHLDYLKQLPLDEIIQKSHQEGVDTMISISVSPDNLDAVLGLSKSNESIFCTQGIHPHDASKFNPDVLVRIKKAVMTEEKVVAIGEIGLDFHYDNSPRDVQRDVFKQHLELACELNKPVVIHSRDAEIETEEILSLYLDKLTRKGVIHSFSSKLDLAHFAIKSDFYLGFNGMITFKKADEIREAVKLCPMNRILLETDAPFLTPMPHRGKENAPFYLKHIAEKVAEVKSISIDEVIAITNQNAMDLFKLPI